MKKSIIISFFAVLTAVGFTSCLDTENDRVVDWDRDLTPQDSVYHLLGILNNIKEIGARYMLLGEVRGDLMSATQYAPTDVQELHAMNISNTNSYTSKREYYQIINQCNYLIEKGQAIPLERAAAITIRAWTYLQLVLNYGTTKYYENFIATDADANAEYPEYDIDALAEIIIPQLEAIKDLPRPDYKDVGGVNLRTQMFEAKFVLGDYYLWAGTNNPAYYEQAAQLYYDLIYNVGGSSSHLSSAPYTTSGGDPWYADQQNIRWASSMYTDINQLTFWSRTNSREAYTYINYPNPDSTSVRSNIDTLCGYPYYRVEDIGIKPSSVASTNFTTTSYAFIDREKEAEYINSSFVSYVQPIEADYGHPGDLRQLRTMMPASYLTLNYGGGIAISPDSAVYKYSYAQGSNRKDISVYRVATMYLRYAEAVNRAGKPNLAMIALKYGLNPANIRMYMPFNEKPDAPSHGHPVEGVGYYRLSGWNKKTSQAAWTVLTYFHKDYIYENEGKLLLSYDPVRGLYENENSDTIYYCFNDTAQSYYDFSTNLSYFQYNMGLHSRGSGCAAADTTFKMPYDVHPMPRYGYTDVTVLEKQQAYMDSIICREYALETAFEGGRFYDLMRFSRYQGSPKFLADRVSKKPGVSNPALLYEPSQPGRWDSKSWYLPLKASEKQ